MSKKPNQAQDNIPTFQPTVSAEDFIVPAVKLLFGVKIAGEYVSAKSIVQGLTRSTYDELIGKGAAEDYVDESLVDPILEEAVDSQIELPEQA